MAIAASATFTVSGAGGADFVGGVFPTGTVSFAAGETSRTITIQVAGDATVEPDEAFTVALSAPSAGAAIAAASANGTIRNDDGGGGTITGTAGDDTLLGAAGAELIRGVGGDDLLVGGAGIDVASYTDAMAGVVAR